MIKRQRLSTEGFSNACFVIKETGGKMESCKQKVLLGGDTDLNELTLGGCTKGMQVSDLFY